MSETNNDNEVVLSLSFKDRSRSLSLTSSRTGSFIKKNSERKLQSIQCYCLILYFLIIIALICLFSFNKNLNGKMMDFFTNIDENMDFDQFLLFALFLIFLVAIGFPTMPWELALGYFFKSYILAYFLDICCKMCGFMIIFCISKLFLKNKIDEFLRHNKYYRIIKLGVVTHPYKTVFLIKITMIPHLLKNYGLNITDITFTQYIIPSFVESLIFCAIWVYLGRQFSGLGFMNLFDNGDSKHQITVFKFVLLGITLISITTIVCYATKMYKNLEQEIEKEDTHHPQLEVKDYGACVRNS